MKKNFHFYFIIMAIMIALTAGLIACEPAIVMPEPTADSVSFNYTDTEIYVYLDQDYKGTFQLEYTVLPEGSDVAFEIEAASGSGAIVYPNGKVSISKTGQYYVTIIAKEVSDTITLIAAKETISEISVVEGGFETDDVNAFFEGDTLYLFNSKSVRYQFSEDITLDTQYVDSYKDGNSFRTLSCNEFTVSVDGDANPKNVRVIEYASNFTKPLSLTFYEEKISENVGDDTFTGSDKAYYVGTDNTFELIPNYMGSNGVVTEGINSISNYAVYLVVDGTPTLLSEYSEYVEFNNEGMLFKIAAQGKTFRITQSLKFQNKSFTYTDFAVVEGYNIHNVEDLNEVSGATWLWSPAPGGRPQFVRAKPTFEVNSVLIHNNLTITEEDIDSNYIVQANESDWDYERADESLADTSILYYFEGKEGQDFNFVGNFFTIDGSELPLVWREHMDEPADEAQPDKIVAVNARLFVFGNSEISINQGNVNIKNLNMVGNTQVSGEFAKSGGYLMMGVSTATASLNNVHVKNSGVSYTFDGETTVANLENCYSNESFTSAFFIWNSKVTVKNSIFKKCGGPIAAMQDAIKNDDATGFTVLEGCTLENYVIGTEGWFIMYNSVVLATQIKGELEESVNAVGRSILKVENEFEKFNFIAVMQNKDFADADQTDNPEIFTTIDGWDFSTVSPLFQSLTAMGFPSVLTNSAGGIFADAANLQTIEEIFPGNMAKLAQGKYLGLFIKSAGGTWLGLVTEFTE